MSKPPACTPSWDTSSFGDSTNMLEVESSALGEHLTHCGRSRGPWPGVRNGAGVVRAFVAPRLVTTVLLIAVIAGLAWLVS